MATAVWARNCAGAAASTDAMPIAATVKYSLALSVMGCAPRTIFSVALVAAVRRGQRARWMRFCTVPLASQ
jgi:hypothetical protein